MNPLTEQARASVKAGLRDVCKVCEEEIFSSYFVDGEWTHSGIANKDYNHEAVPKSGRYD